MSRVIVITGGSGGLGRLTAERFTAAGDTVCVLSRSVPQGGSAAFFECDVRREAAVKAALDAAAARFGAFDVLICNAGAGISGVLEYLPEGAAEDNMGVNFFGAYYTVKHGLKHMKKGGTVLSVSSAAALFPVPFREIYSAGKAAMNMMTLGLSLQTDAVRAVTVCPGEIDTPFTQNRAVYTGTDAKYGRRAQRAAGRIKQGKKRMDAGKVADKLVRIASKKRVKRFYIIGFKTKCHYFLFKILPFNLFLRLIGMTHGGKGKKERNT